MKGHADEAQETVWSEALPMRVSAKSLAGDAGVVLTGWWLLLFPRVTVPSKHRRDFLPEDHANVGSIFQHGHEEATAPGRGKLGGLT